MGKLDYKESWVLKNWCSSPTVVLEKTLESPLDCKEIQQVNPKWTQSWIFIGIVDAEDKTPIIYFSHLMLRADSSEKTLMLGKTEGRRRRGRQKMRWLDGITNSMDMNLSQTLGVGDGQRALAYCSPWGYEKLDTTEWLKWTKLKINNLNHMISCLI